MYILFLILGALLILGGAHFLTEGASSLAKSRGVSPLVIGLTIVAFGTSAPELTVSVSSALKGSPDIALGNVIGSNIFNVLLIGGISALLVPLTVSRSTLRYELPMAVALSFLLFFLTLGGLFGSRPHTVGRVDGLILLICFALFLVYNLHMAKRGEVGLGSEEIKTYPVRLCVVFIVGGLAALISGGDLFVRGAVGIARGLGVSESVIGLTVVAVGTSLPELATSVVAALKGQHALAVGNIVGSNIFNLTAILGITALIKPLHTGGIATLDYAFLIASVLLLYSFAAVIGKRRIMRLEGLCLLLCAGLYIFLLIGANRV